MTVSDSDLESVLQRCPAVVGTQLLLEPYSGIHIENLLQESNQDDPTVLNEAEYHSRVQRL